MSEGILVLFEDCHGRPVPRLPMTKDGEPRVSDGSQYFSLDLAAAHFQRPKAELEQIWSDFMADFVPRESEPYPDAMQPQSDVAWCTAAQRDGLYRSRYHHLSREQFDTFIAEADRLKLNPLRNQIWADVRHDQKSGRPRLIIRVSFQSQLLLVHRTGRYVGCEATRFEFMGEERRNPHNATSTIYKLVRGKRRPYSATVFWDESAPPAGTDDFWEQRPKLAMSYRAKAAALKEAFPRQLGGIYLPDDFNDTARDTQRKTGQAITIGAPTTRFQAEAEMIGMGVADPTSRGEIIDALIARFRQAYDRDERNFWGVALAYLKRNPHEFRNIG